MTWAYGLTLVFSSVFLKNCRESATWSASTRWTTERYVTFGVPSSATVAIAEGMIPSKQLEMLVELCLEILGPHSGFPASGPGV